MSALAKDLCKLYPLLGDPLAKENGYTMWFFFVSGQNCSTGFLEERVKSQRLSFLKKHGCTLKKYATHEHTKGAEWASDEGEILNWQIFVFIHFNLTLNRHILKLV